MWYYHYRAEGDNYEVTFLYHAEGVLIVPEFYVNIFIIHKLNISSY